MKAIIGRVVAPMTRGFATSYTPETITKITRAPASVEKYPDVSRILREEGLMEGDTITPQEYKAAMRMLHPDVNKAQGANKAAQALNMLYNTREESKAVMEDLFRSKDFWETVKSKLTPEEKKFYEKYDKEGEERQLLKQIDGKTFFSIERTPYFGHDVNDGHLRFFGEVLKANKTLTSLELRRAVVTDKGVTDFMESLKENEALQSIKFYKCRNMTNDVFKIITKAVEHTSLTEVIFEKCDIGNKELLAELQNALEENRDKKAEGGTSVPSSSVATSSEALSKLAERLKSLVDGR